MVNRLLPKRRLPLRLSKFDATRRRAWIVQILDKFASNLHKTIGSLRTGFSSLPASLQSKAANKAAW
jgi:hypothetical protein